MNNFEYFEKEVPQTLTRLTADTQPHWGSMDAWQMLDHLRKGVILSIENTEDEITTPDERLPLYKKFLMSDKPFGQNLPKPAAFDRVEALPGEMDEKKQQLLDELRRMKQYFKDNPGHVAIHPNFGRLNTEEWLQLHHKHFTHHFNQFGLL